ncbi:MAG: hypothetical protein CND29_01290 [Marine Group II euryarchaeote MED-G36]|jgi:hypothetical protein|nr:MAG: hypothetical protein CND29_01290 [Marine Group II euryarchaeote MED-G36]
MAGVPLPMFQMQLAFAIGLAGIYFGWRGAMARMTGFYDLSGAFKSLVIGIISGAFAAAAIDALILISIRNEELNIIEISFIALLIAMAESAFTLFLLGRPKTVGLRASAPYGWTLGLGIGSMRAAYLNVRLFDDQTWGVTGFDPINVLVAFLITITACLGHAMIAAWQGSRIVENQRGRTFFTSSLARVLLILGTVFAVFNPLLLLLVAPAIPLFWEKSQKEWLADGLTPSAKQAYRRTVRGSSRHADAAAKRKRGQRVNEEE